MRYTTGARNQLSAVPLMSSTSALSYLRPVRRMSDLSKKKLYTEEGERVEEKLAEPAGK